MSLRAALCVLRIRIRRNHRNGSYKCGVVKTSRGYLWTPCHPTSSRLAGQFVGNEMFEMLWHEHFVISNLRYRMGTHIHVLAQTPKNTTTTHHAVKRGVSTHRIVRLMLKVRDEHAVRVNTGQPNMCVAKQQTISPHRAVMLFVSAHHAVWGRPPQSTLAR